MEISHLCFLLALCISISTAAIPETFDSYVVDYVENRFTVNQTSGIRFLNRVDPTQVLTECADVTTTRFYDVVGVAVLPDDRIVLSRGPTIAGGLASESTLVYDRNCTQLKECNINAYSSLSVDPTTGKLFMWGEIKERSSVVIGLAELDVDTCNVTKRCPDIVTGTPDTQHVAVIGDFLYRIGTSGMIMEASIPQDNLTANCETTRTESSPSFCTNPNGLTTLDVETLLIVCDNSSVVLFNITSFTFSDIVENNVTVGLFDMALFPNPSIVPPPPTTVPPTTVAPTTAPTTTAPTAASNTTVAPTTTAPTATSNTTVAPTTAAPTTSPPSSTSRVVFGSLLVLSMVMLSL